MALSKGLKRHAPGQVAHRLGVALHPKIGAALLRGPKGGADLSAFRPPRMNQRRSQKCHSHSRAAGLYTAWAALGLRLPFVPSPEVIAACTYADVRDANTPIGAPLKPLVDEGATLQDSEDATRRWGIAPILPASSDPNAYTDCPDGTANALTPEPDRARLEIAGARLQAPEYIISPNGTRMSLQVIAALDVGIPSQSANPVGPRFEGLQPGQVAMPEPDGDGHAQVIDVYRPITAAEKAACGSKEEFVFEVNGSWGPYVCVNGIFVVSMEWVDEGWEYCPLLVSPSAA